MQDRVCFFSKYDLSIGHYLEMAETRIKEVSEGNVPNDFEGIIELWHIKQLFENNCKLTKWSNVEFGYYLDNSNFTNGFAYRNHYMHGSISSVNDEQKHTIAYMIFLRMLAILLLKIDDDLRLAQRAIVIYAKSQYKKL